MTDAIKTVQALKVIRGDVSEAGLLLPGMNDSMLLALKMRMAQHLLTLDALIEQMQQEAAQPTPAQLAHGALLPQVTGFAAPQAAPIDKSTLKRLVTQVFGEGYTITGPQAAPAGEMRPWQITDDHRRHILSTAVTLSDAIDMTECAMRGTAPPQAAQHTSVALTPQQREDTGAGTERTREAKAAQEPVGYASTAALSALKAGHMEAASLVRADDAEDGDVPLYRAAQEPAAEAQAPDSAEPVAWAVVTNLGGSPLAREVNMSELKSCPFCGGTNIGTSEGSTFRWRYAECNECGAQAGEVRVQTLGDGTVEQWQADAHAEAIAAWNRRAGESRKPMALTNDQVRQLMQVANEWAGPDETDSRFDNLEMALRALRVGITDAGKGEV